MDKTPLKINYVVYTKVETIKPIGKEPNVTWWVQFEGSSESLHFGSEKPFDVGDEIKITFERLTDATLKQPPK